MSAPDSCRRLCVRFILRGGEQDAQGRGYTSCVCWTLMQQQTSILQLRTHPKPMFGSLFHGTGQGGAMTLSVQDVARSEWHLFLWMCLCLKLLLSPWLLHSFFAQLHVLLIFPPKKPKQTINSGNTMDVIIQLVGSILLCMSQSKYLFRIH